MAIERLLTGSIKDQIKELLSTEDLVIDVVCWESCESCNDFPQPPVGITCITGNSGTVFTDECNAQGNWTGDFDNANNGYFSVKNRGHLPPKVI